jgi:hypothetical protein
MLGLYRRPCIRGHGLAARAILRLESLEWRDQPSTLDPGGGAADDQYFYLTPAPNEAPDIVDFTAREVGTGLFLVSGRVIDESPGGLTVTLDGDTAASGTTTTTLEDGTFSVLVRLPTDGTGAGYITATTVDNRGLVSDEVSAFVNPTVEY